MSNHGQGIKIFIQNLIISSRSHDVIMEYSFMAHRLQDADPRVNVTRHVKQDIIDKDYKSSFRSSIRYINTV